MAPHRATKHIFLTFSYQVSTRSAPIEGPLIHVAEQGFRRINIHTWLGRVTAHGGVLLSQTQPLEHRLLTPSSLLRYITVEKCSLMQASAR